MTIHTAIRVLARTRSVGPTAEAIGVDPAILTERLRAMTPDETAELSAALTTTESQVA